MSGSTSPVARGKPEPRSNQFDRTSVVGFHGVSPSPAQLRRDRRIAGGLKDFAGDHARRLVLAVPVPFGAGERGEDDLRPEAPDDADRVLEQDLPRPEAERFLDGRVKPKS